MDSWEAGKKGEMDADIQTHIDNTDKPSLIQTILLSFFSFSLHIHFSTAPSLSLSISFSFSSFPTFVTVSVVLYIRSTTRSKVNTIIWWWALSITRCLPDTLSLSLSLSVCVCAACLDWNTYCYCIYNVIYLSDMVSLLWWGCRVVTVSPRISESYFLSRVSNFRS